MFVNRYGAHVSEGDIGERQSWHGMNQPKPVLPSYLRPGKRLKSLNEFEAPAWKGRVKFGERADRGNWIRWAIVFLIAVLLGCAVGWELAQPHRCVGLATGFKIGWC